MPPKGLPLQGAVDVSAHFERLCADLAHRLPALGHIDPRRVLFCISRSRAEGTHGVYARIAPLRFSGGRREETRRRGRYLETFRLPDLRHRGQEILYLVYILFPRFLRLSYEQRLSTIIHELYHISENFDGDIRRFAGRNYAHGSSRKGFNETVAGLMERYLATDPSPELLQVLQLSEQQWANGQLRITGLKVSLPRATLVDRRRPK
ncbi:hypothetical protein DESUT3_08620 [Desulfuromonas versatilis]|uniref:Putative phage metallopeptidase domain-containing protein n=1 Tax=Desulfuromonas versatilis TaxID=2802975 RepID=A0ABM9SDF6_9BACT|nr:putative metallopeptidase [Desulfuromonas versatilis]BCR03793.1 hypothetical protein DESUT3_08620 [Desulfuromonas versatilis]